MVNRIIEICMGNRLLVLVTFVFLTAAGWWALNRTPIDAIPDIGEIRSSCSPIGPGEVRETSKIR